MRILTAVLLSSLLVACNKPVAKPTYTIQTREISKNNYQIKLEGRPDTTQEQLQGFMQAKADELCNKAFVLRHNKEESLLAPGEKANNPNAKYDRYGLTVEIECVTDEWEEDAGYKSLKGKSKKK